MNKRNKQEILFSVIVVIIVFLYYLMFQSASQPKTEIAEDNKIEMAEYNKILLENKELIKENKKLEVWSIECHDHWEDRYDMQSERDYEELLIYVDFYVQHEEIIKGLIYGDKADWINSYDNLSIQKEYCFGCDGIDKLRHEHLLKEVENQWGCNNCY